MVSTSIRGRKDVAQFLPINPDGLSDRELLEAAVKGINNTHDCVHRLASETAASHIALKTEMDHVKTEVGDLKTDRDVTNGRIEKLAKMFGAESWQPGESRVKPRGIGGWSTPKAAAAGMFIILAALVAHASTYDFVRHILVAGDAYLVQQAQQQAGQGEQPKK